MLTDIPTQIANGFNVIVRGSDIRPHQMAEKIKGMLSATVSNVQIVIIENYDLQSIKYLADEMRFNLTDALIMVGNSRLIPAHILVDIFDRGRTILITDERTFSPAISNRGDICTNW
jgi:hypothetical protein